MREDGDPIPEPSYAANRLEVAENADSKVGSIRREISR
jgi:hypothetical protein